MIVGHAEMAAPLRQQEPSQKEIRNQLERVIGSPEFHVPARAVTFLRYIVEETLAGRAGRIKGYSIAVEVFARDTDFSQDDPVVRIEAGRLRRALERYYLIAGQDDPIRVEIPKGGYVPAFKWNHSNSSSGVLPENAAPMETRAYWPRLLSQRAHFFVAGTLALIICLTAGAYWTFGPPASNRLALAASGSAGMPSGLNGPSLLVAPFADLGEGPESGLYATGITEELLSVLPRFKELRVMGRETSRALPSKVDASLVRDELGARYLLAGAVQVSGAKIRVTARLVETETGVILWSQTYDDNLRLRDLFAIRSDVAAKVATIIAQPYGVIYQADLANAPPEDPSAYRCTLQFYAYRGELSAEEHAAVRECLERVVADFPTYVTAWSMLSIVYVDEDRFGFNPRSGAPGPLLRSLTAAQRAVELDPSNIRALQSLMTALFLSNRLGESIEIGERGLALNPNDTEFLGEFGSRLALSGQWQRGAAMLRDALAHNPGGGGFYHAVLALSAYMLRDDQTSLVEIRQANLSSLPLFHAVAAIIYAQHGMMKEATREGQTFVKLRPTFMSNINSELRKRNFTESDSVRIVAGLQKAGLLPVDRATSISSSQSQ
jgi:adenylate cyclase